MDVSPRTGGNRQLLPVLGMVVLMGLSEAAGKSDGLSAIKLCF